MRKLKIKRSKKLKKIGMKYVFLTVLLTVFTSVGWSQNFSKLKSIPLKDSIDCKNAEPKVLECCNYLLTTPCAEETKKLLGAFIVKWMFETSDYEFAMDRLFVSVSKSGGKDKTLGNMFAISMAKTALTDKIDSSNEDFKKKFLTTFIEYCENPDFKVKQSSFIKKMIKAKNDNTLEDFIREQSK